MISGAKRMSFRFQGRTIKDYDKSGSQFSLDSVCSSGYDSAHTDSRTVTPSDLQFGHGPPECCGDNFITTTSSMDPCKCSTSDPQIQEASSCTDSLSLYSSSTTLSLYSCATYNDHLHSTSFKSTPKSHDTQLTEKEHKVNQECSYDGASQVIHSLKHRSDGWTGPLVKPTDPIISRLKLGRTEAIKRQEVIEIFLEEASSQLKIQQEASKAQSMCANLEYFEAERLILLAGERYCAYMSEAQQMVSKFGESLTTPNTQEDTESIVPCSATLYLTGIKLILCESFTRKLKSSPATHHFLCLVKEAKSKGITATHIATLSSTTCTDTTFRIEFNNCFTLPWILHDFELIIEVYHLALDDSVQPLKQKVMNVISCLTLKTPALVNRYNPQFLLSSCMIPSIETEGVSDHEKAEPLLSKFQKIGSVGIDRGCLKQRVFSMEPQSSVVCAVQAFLQAEPDIVSVIDDLPIQGYLSFFGGHQWERRWFVLTSHSLSYWLYPDQPEHSEPPVSTWNLSECTSLSEIADPNICAWEHSFMLPLQTGCSRELLLSAESEAQLNQWMTALNVLIICLSTWKP